MSDHRTQSVFSYPSPSTNPPPKTDISLREILDTYRDNNDLLKQILTAKAEEDKRRAEEEKYKTEAVRLQCKQVELEMLKEQKKPPTIFTGVPHAHFPANATTPTSATRLSPPSSSNDSVSYNHNGISSHNNSYNPLSQRPSLTLSIPSFPIITASPTTMHNQHPFSTPTSSVQEHPSSASSQTNHYSQSPTTGGKRSKPSSESEVDHDKTCINIKSYGIMVTNIYCRNSIKKKAKELGVLLTDPHRAKRKIDDFFEDLRPSPTTSDSESYTKIDDFFESLKSFTTTSDKNNVTSENEFEHLKTFREID
ncbi:8454_t:CDS:2 [Gigaspora margarita]|uniref:8454_t:CDS:1 n=1 Tax=Gigaspora margarita TaxID=4874 RepID=A0ABN7V3X6_GIGMA|nr:8454_t:CDS:2 [Gigaspora margarita]